ncbi:hypothetical protein SY88_17965 [Clostridiales bacterium PH28_bin88]|nr:hypothetical protein SY88_17965 [Clostridiales bacterium PH28_bin88]
MVKKLTLCVLIVACFCLVAAAVSSGPASALPTMGTDCYKSGCHAAGQPPTKASVVKPKAPKPAPAAPATAKPAEPAKPAGTAKPVTAVPAVKTGFADLKNSPAAAAVRFLADRKIISGITSTKFGVNNKLTRAELAAFALRLGGLPEVTAVEVELKDVPKSAWYYSAVQAAISYGLLKPDVDGKFQPKAPADQATVMYALVKAGAAAQVDGLTLQETRNVLSMLPGVKGISEDPVWAFAWKAGILSGGFTPDAAVTRGDAALWMKAIYDAR